MKNVLGACAPSNRIVAYRSWTAAVLVALLAGCGSGDAEERETSLSAPAATTAREEQATQRTLPEDKVFDRGRDLDPSLTASEREIIERYAHLVSEKKATTFRSNRWLGIITLQYPTDAWIIQELIFEVKPDFIIEAGTYEGGSAAMWALVLEQVNPNGRVITIDINDRSEEARKLAIVQRRVDFMLGSSTNPKIVAEITERTRGSRVMVILDSFHGRKHVLAELAAYAPLVEVGSYLIVQDTGGIMIQDPNPGPRQALDEFLKTHPEFEPDRSRERMLLTMNPKGYLRRVR